MLCAQADSLVSIMCHVDIDISAVIVLRACANGLADRFKDPIQIGVLCREGDGPVDDGGPHSQRPFTQIIVPLQFETSGFKVNNIATTNKRGGFSCQCGCIESIECSTRERAERFGCG